MTNAYPSNDKPYAGIFVKNQFEFLAKENSGTSIFFMPRKFTGTVGSILKYLWAFGRFLPKFFSRIDIIHIHFLSPLVIIAFLYKLFHTKTKLILTSHGSDVTTLKRGSIRQQLYTRILRKFDVIIVVGEELIHDVEQKLGLSPTHILPAGVDKGTFRPLNLEKEIDFGFVGSFTKTKGVDLLTKAILQWNQKKALFVFIGSGELESEIQKVRDAGLNVEIMQNLNQNELCKMYNSMKWLVIPSRRDAFGLVISEAIYCGTPAIVSPLPAFKRQVTNGLNGIILDSLSIDDLVTKLNRAYNMNCDEYQTLAINATKMNAEFSLEFVGNKLKQIYEEQIRFAG